jgi:hypothetical protein
MRMHRWSRADIDRVGHTGYNCTAEFCACVHLSYPILKYPKPSPSFDASCRMCSTYAEVSGTEFRFGNVGRTYENVTVVGLEAGVPPVLMRQKKGS